MSLVAIVIFTVFTLMLLAIEILTIVAKWKLFVKAGKPGWACIVPFYAQFCQFDFVWGNGWLFLLTFVPCVNIIISIIMFFKLAKVFGKGIGFGFGLLFLNTIFLFILAFGNAQYLGIDPQQSQS